MKSYQNLVSALLLAAAICVPSVLAGAASAGNPAPDFTLIDSNGIEHTLSGFSGKTVVLEWVNHADLYRIRGVGSEYADLLEAAGVDTVVELATRNPTNLYKKLMSVNEEKKLVRRLPVQAQVVEWVEQAKTLPRVISY